MIIARIGEVHSAAAELYPGLKHSAVHTVTVEPLPSKSREQSGMHIHHTSNQIWGWFIERQKTG